MDQRLSSQKLIDHSSKEPYSVYKWVHLKSEQTNEFRFIHVKGIHINFNEAHNMLVSPDERASVVGAGTIIVNKSDWRSIDMGSSTLNVGCDVESLEALSSFMVSAGRTERRI